MILRKSVRLYLLGKVLIDIVFVLFILLLSVYKTYDVVNIFKQYYNVQGFVASVENNSQGSLLSSAREELFFRGLIILLILRCISHLESRKLDRQIKLKKVLPAFLSSLLFALFHVLFTHNASTPPLPWFFLVTFIGGFMFLEGFFFFNKLLFSLGIHFCWNLLYGVFFYRNSPISSNTSTNIF